MRADFYQLSRDPVEAALPLIARATMTAGERLLVVSADAAQLDGIAAALWTREPASFLANGRAGGAHDARQPILLSDRVAPTNGARFCALADGVWRDGEAAFARTFLMFDETTVAGARAAWRMLGTRERVERHFWKQADGGGWVEGP